MKTSSPELWRALETIWEVTSDYQSHSDIPPLGMVMFTVITNGKHPYGLTGRRESAPDAMKVKCLKTFFHFSTNRTSYTTVQLLVLVVL